MKGYLSKLCVMLLVLAVCGACYGKTSHKAAKKPAKAHATQASTQASPPDAGQSSAKNSNPDATAMMAEAAPAAPASAPAAPAAGPAASVPATSDAGVAMTVDDNYVYLLQNGKLYKFAKNDVSACGTAVPPPCPSPTGAGPAPCNCAGISYIPGYPSYQSTTTTYTPCPAAPTCPTGTGAGPCATPCGQSCNPCPAPTCGPATIVSCAPNCLPSCPPKCTTSCNPCGNSCSPCGNTCNPCATTQTTNCSTVTTACGPTGCGPTTTCAAIAGVDTCTQATIANLQTLCGADVDKAYLQANMQLNMSVLNLSNGMAQYLGTTRLQDYATNSIDDSRSRISQDKSYLRTKFCLVVATCTPSGGFCPDICHLGRAFDDSYKNQLIQYYVDEIALAQVELQRGLDCQVKAAAAATIENDQIRISRLTRCSSCG